MSASFIPFRRNVAYAEIRRECPIAVIRTHPEWKKYAARLRYGHFEISEDFFNFVHNYMLAESKTPATGARQESLF